MSRAKVRSRDAAGARMIRAIAASTLAIFVVSSGVALGGHGFGAATSRVPPVAGVHGEVTRGMLIRTDGGFLFRHRSRP